MENLSFNRADRRINPSQSEKISKNVGDLLAEAQELLKQKPTKKEYLDPFRSRIYYECLTNQPNADPIAVINIYIKDLDKISYPPPDLLVGKFVIIHGHNMGKGCAAPYFCHQLGYKPTGQEHPSFLRNFYQRWPQLR